MLSQLSRHQAPGLAVAALLLFVGVRKFTAAPALAAPSKPVTGQELSWADVGVDGESTACRDASPGFVAPMIPDCAYVPLKWRAAPQGKRHIPDWTRAMDLRGPLINYNRSGLVVPELPGYPACEVMINTLEEFGQNVGSERISTYDTHGWGQVVMRTAMKKRVDLKAVFRDINTLAFEGQKLSYDAPRSTRIGQLHGATVVYMGELLYHHKAALANTTQDYRALSKAFWDNMLETVCAMTDGSDGFPPTPYYQMHFCLHGIGHAISYHTIRSWFPVDKSKYICLPPPIPEIQDMWRAFDSIKLCESSPYPAVVRACTYGVWHGISEFSVDRFYKDPDGKPREEFLYPCNELERYSANCYTLLFSFLGFGDFRFKAIQRLSKRPAGLVDICLAGGQVNEVNVRGCIWGMSATFFVLFDKVAAARTAADLRLSPRRDRFTNASLWGKTMGAEGGFLNAYDLAMWPGPDSIYEDAYTWGAPKMHGDLMFDSGIIPQTYVRDTLVEWCQHFAGDGPISGGRLSVRDWNRWKTCIRGAFEWCSMLTMMNLGEPWNDLSRRDRWCPQMLEVPWLNESLRQESYAICQISALPPAGIQYDAWAAHLDNI